MSLKFSIKLKNIIVLIAGIAVVAVLGFVWWFQYKQPGKFDDFAKCLKDKGAIFYGAFWCPHCQNQKKLFGKSEKYLTYIECSTPDRSGQLPVCSREKIQGYPTWQFSDGSREEGELSLQQLSDKSGCQLSQ